MPFELSWFRPDADDLMPAADDALIRKREALTAIYAVPGPERTFLNTIAAFQDADAPVADLRQRLDLLIAVHPDMAVREAARRAVDHIDEENVTLDYDRRLWDAVTAWDAHREPLDAIDAKLADDTLRDFRRMGFGLGTDAFTRLTANITELRKLETEFEKSINDWDDGILVTREQLTGLPGRYIEGLRREGERYRVSLEYPEFFPFMQLADDGDLRRELATKHLRKGGPENLERLVRMVRLRRENAALLGYTTHADFVAEPRMVGTGAAVRSFLEGVIVQLEPAARREREELRAFKRRVTGDAEADVGFHETAYWGHKLLHERYDVDAEQVKEYFPLRRVIDGMLAIYQDILGLRFRELADTATWHPDARVYEVSGDRRVLGHFVLDLHPRKGKYGHAASFPVVLGRTERDGAVTTGLVALVCNFAKPTPSNPSLLAHDEVETLLHEFGHVMHALLSGGRWQRQNGFNAPLDFVETPSQLFEEWAWAPAALVRLSGHYRTGEPMPDILMRKLIAARHHMGAHLYLQQAVRALFDFSLHDAWPEDALTADGLADGYRSLRERYEEISLPRTSLFPAGWSHMADYDAGYYSYLWSKVYALDLFTRFAGDPLNASTGRAYRRDILEPGASRPERDSVVAFLGREPSEIPFLVGLGISKNA